MKHHLFRETRQARASKGTPLNLIGNSKERDEPPQVKRGRERRNRGGGGLMSDVKKKKGKIVNQKKKKKKGEKKRRQIRPKKKKDPSTSKFVGVCPGDTRTDQKDGGVTKSHRSLKAWETAIGVSPFASIPSSKKSGGHDGRNGRRKAVHAERTGKPRSFFPVAAQPGRGPEKSWNRLDAKRAVCQAL